MFRLILAFTLLAAPILAEEPKKEEAKKEDIKKDESKKEEKAENSSLRAKQIVKNPEDASMKKLVEMMAAFDRFAENKDKYIDGTLDWAKYKAGEKAAADRISTFIDFFEVCEKSLKYDMDPKTKKFKKDHWKSKTQQQKEHFVALFRKLIEAIVYPATIDFFGKMKIEHSVVKNDGKNAALQSIIYYKKKDAIMEWYMHKQANGSWIVYDIGIEGERWVPSFRSQFNDIISKKSYNELLNMMQKKLDETIADNEKKDKQSVKKKTE